jgi:predicted signal transduction protein with EAL and GGDEF domain
LEHEEQASHLRALGCGWAQGYHFARPAPASAIESLIGRVSFSARPVRRLVEGVNHRRSKCGLECSS